MALIADSVKKRSRKCMIYHNRWIDNRLTCSAIPSTRHLQLLHRGRVEEEEEEELMRYAIID